MQILVNWDDWKQKMFQTTNQYAYHNQRVCITMKANRFTFHSRSSFGQHTLLIPTGFIKHGWLENALSIDKWSIFHCHVWWPEGKSIHILILCVVCSHVITMKCSQMPHLPSFSQGASRTISPRWEMEIFFRASRRIVQRGLSALDFLQLIYVGEVDLKIAFEVNYNIS